LIHASIFTREGLPIEAVTGIGSALIDPLLTGPLLLGLLYYPEQIQSFLPASARKYVESAAIFSTLRFLVGWGVLRKINKFSQSNRTQQFTADVWNVGKEVVVVSGASNGMGAAITRGIAKIAGSVIALDLYPPEQPCRK
jgi:hypothetical protein